MVKFNIHIDGRDHTFPTRLTVEQWMKIMKWDIDSKQNWPQIIATLFGVHPRDLKDASDFTIELGIGLLVGLLNERKESKYKNFGELTFGEWIDLDVWISEGVTKTMDKMLTILGDTEWSDEALHKIEAYTQWRTYIYRQYSELFGLDYETEDGEIVDEDEDTSPPLSPAESWWSIVIGLASDNILHVDAVTEQPLLKTFNFMAHQKNKAITENFKKYKKQKEYELQRNR